MNVPEWVQSAVWGGFMGALLIAVLSFSAGWVVTSGSAEKMVEQEVEKAVIAALTPICVAQFKSQAQEMRTTQLAALEEESSYQRGDYVEEHGWATMPGGGESSDDVAAACATELMKLAQK